MLRRPLSRCKVLGIRAQAAAGVISQSYSAPAQQVRGRCRQRTDSTLRICEHQQGLGRHADMVL